MSTLVSDKEKFNKEGWVCVKPGIRKRSNKFNGTITIPWSLIIKKNTSIKGLRVITAKTKKIKLYQLEKMVDSQRIIGLFDTEKDALKYLDKALIMRGKEPMYVLKKLTNEST